MDQYLLIPFLGGWTSIYHLFWCEQKGYKVLTHCHIYTYIYITIYLLYMFPVVLMKKPCCWSIPRPPRRLRKPPRPRERPGTQPALTVRFGESTVVRTRWENGGTRPKNVEKCGKRIENHGKGWENGIKTVLFHANYRTNKVNKPTWPILDLF